VFVGWEKPLLVGGLFVILELVTYMVLEPLLYGRSAEVSQVALMVAIAFWTWLWGPIGLLLATPLTVCLAVLGKYVPPLAFLDVLTLDPPGQHRQNRLLTPGQVCRQLAAPSPHRGGYGDRQPPPGQVVEQGQCVSPPRFVSGMPVHPQCVPLCTVLHCKREIIGSGVQRTHGDLAGERPELGQNLGRHSENAVGQTTRPGRRPRSTAPK